MAKKELATCAKRSQHEMKETSVVDNNLRRGQPVALTVAQTCLCKLNTKRGQMSFFKQIFMPYVPV